MEGVVWQAVHFIKTEAKGNVMDEKEERSRKLLEEMKDVRLRLDSAYCAFEYAEDDRMIESAILEIGSLESRYGYLIRKAREQGVLHGLR